MAATREQVRQSIFDLTHYWDDKYGIGKWGEVSREELDNCEPASVLIMLGITGAELIRQVQEAGQ